MLRIEFGTVHISGGSFTALGSVVNTDAGIIMGYVKGSELTTWEGQPICPLRTVSHWKQRGQWIFAYRAGFQGREFYGRGLGESMILCLRARKGKS